MAVKQLPKISDLPEPPDRLVGDQERFDVLTFNSLKAQKKMVNEDLNKTLIPALNQFAVDVNASVDAAALSEQNAHGSEEVAKTKAGEAAGSAGAAKVSEDNAKTSETNALASKNAAALSAESAESDRIAAEAARDEAQDLANVGYASESHAGLAKLDGKTTQADADGTITAKDVAIGGNLADLASARGQIGPARELGNNVDFNTVTEAGLYLINATGSVNAPRENQAFFLQVVRSVKGANTKNLFQIAYNYSSVIDWVFIRQYRMASSSWSPWTQFINSSQVGDGLRVTNGIISVPEYEGATASTAGTSGLVPPATAGQQESFLTGSGEYKPALTKISDSVSLADSTTAASATAVKAAYDQGTAGVTAANAKLPLSGGTMLGSIQCGNSAQFVVGTQEAPFYQMRARLFGVHSPDGLLCGIMTADAAANYFSIEPTGGAIVNSYCGRPGSAFQHGFFANINGHPLAATIIGGASGEGWFYRKYSDGFIEQWGMAQTAESGDTIITFSTPFLNGLYNIQLSSVSPAYQDNFYNISMQAYSYSTTSFYVEILNGQTKRLSAPFAWYACGF